MSILIKALARSYDVNMFRQTLLIGFSSVMLSRCLLIFYVLNDCKRKFYFFGPCKLICFVYIGAGAKFLLMVKLFNAVTVVLSLCRLKLADSFVLLVKYVEAQCGILVRYYLSRSGSSRTSPESFV